MITSRNLGIDEDHSPWARPLRHILMPDWIIVVTAVLIIFIGLLTCVGWWTRSQSLVQWFADDAPTHFNTALGFILLGLGELGLVLRHRVLVKSAAGAVLVLAGAEMAEWMLGIDVSGIDTLFAAPFVGAGTLHPGRMSANSAACFLLVAGAQILMSKPVKNTAVITTVAVIMKTIAGGIAFIALLGYVVKLKIAYGWTESVGMSVASWSGFLLIIVARIATLWKRDIVDPPKLPEWFLPFLGTAVTSLSIWLIWILNSP